MKAKTLTCWDQSNSLCCSWRFSSRLLWFILTDWSTSIYFTASNEATKFTHYSAFSNCGWSDDSCDAHTLYPPVSLTILVSLDFMTTTRPSLRCSTKMWVKSTLQTLTYNGFSLFQYFSALCDHYIAAGQYYFHWEFIVSCTSPRPSPSKTPKHHCSSETRFIRQAKDILHVMKWNAIKSIYWS